MSLKRNIFLSLFGAFIQRGASLLVGIYIARFLGADMLGGYALILSNIYMFGAFLTFGITPVASKYISQYINTEDVESVGVVVLVLFFISTILGLLVSTFVFFLSDYIAVQLYSMPEMSSLLKYGAISIFFMAVSAFFTGMLMGYEEFRKVSRLNAFNGLMSALLIAISATYYGLDGMAISIVISQFLVMCFSIIAIFPLTSGYQFNASSTIYRLHLRGMSIFSLSSFMTGVLQGAANWFCLFMLVRASDNLKELAVFHIANQWYSLILFIPNVASTVLLPYLSRQGSSDIGLIMKVYIFCSVGVLVLLASINTLIVNTYGEVLIGYQTILVVTYITGAVVAIKSPIEQAILAADRADIILLFNIFFVFLFLGGGYVYIDYGVSSVVGWRLIGYIFFALFLIIYYFKWLRYSRDA